VEEKRGRNRDCDREAVTTSDRGQINRHSSTAHSAFKDSPNSSQPEPFTQRLADTDVRKLFDQPDSRIPARIRGEIDISLVDDDDTLVVRVRGDSTDGREGDEGSGRVAGRAEEEELGVGLFQEGAFELSSSGNVKVIG
jgi:hypothetical protein